MSFLPTIFPSPSPPEGRASLFYSVHPPHLMKGSLSGR